MDVHFQVMSLAVINRLFSSESIRSIRTLPRSYFPSIDHCHRFSSIAASSSTSAPNPSQIDRSKAPTMADRSIADQKFDYLLILDLEATCDRGFQQPQPQEIIEFPCLKMSTRDWRIESQFHRYVRPVENPSLTSFCTELTGIVQAMVDGQENLRRTLELFDEWLRQEGLVGQDGVASPNWSFVTCGDWDLKTMLKKQCEHFDYARPSYFRRWINVKKMYFDRTRQFPKGMMQMLETLNLVHQGKHHSGIDDTRNIAEIVRVLALRGARFDFTSRDE